MRGLTQREKKEEEWIKQLEATGKWASFYEWVVFDLIGTIIFAISADYDIVRLVASKCAKAIVKHRKNKEARKALRSRTSE